MFCSSGAPTLQASRAACFTHAAMRHNPAAKRIGSKYAAIQPRPMSTWHKHASTQQHLHRCFHSSREVRAASLGRRALLSFLAPFCCTCSVCGHRNSWYDSFFAFNMAHGMEEYEAAIAPLKQAMFKQLLTPLVCDSQTAANMLNILEVGLGTGPNLPFYPQLLQGTDKPNISNAFDSQQPDPAYVITGIEPNPAMWEYAHTSARQAGMMQQQLQLVAADAQELPYESNMFDAAVVTLVLCSLPDPRAALSEVLRVLKPGGQLLLIEHVIDPRLSWRQVQQRLLNPLQMLLADNCHLTRDTAAMVQTSGFVAQPLELIATAEGLPGLQLAAKTGGETGGSGIDLELLRFDVRGMGLIAPHIAGILRKI